MELGSDSMPASKPSKPKRRRLRIIGGITAAAVVGWFIYATVNIVHPGQGHLQARSDAVVSLAPQPHRLPLAKQLVNDGVADLLVISYFKHDPLNTSPSPTGDATTLAQECDAAEDNQTICFTPEDDATIGEVSAIAELAAEHSWDSLTVVTNTHHAFRTRFIFQRCLGDDVDVNVVFADRDLTASEGAWYAVYENAAFLKAVWDTTVQC